MTVEYKVFSVFGNRRVLEYTGTVKWDKSWTYVLDLVLDGAGADEAPLVQRKVVFRAGGRVRYTVMVDSWRRQERWEPSLGSSNNVPLR